MGTFVVISAWGRDGAVLNDAVSRAFDEIHRLDAKLSLHRPDSELSVLNAQPAGEWRRVSSELFEVVSLAQDISRQTQGAFDATIRPLSNLWGFIWREYRLPGESELQQVLPRVDWRLVDLDSTRPRIRFLKPGISLDLGGIGKGFAVDRAVQVLTNRGVERVLVRTGGDMRAVAPPPGHDGWTVQLEDPEKQGRRTTLSLAHRALSTSGDYENYFEVEGRRYSHVLDPRSGLPVANVAAVSLTAPTCAESDAWATACFVLGPSRSLARYGDRFGMKFSLPPRWEGEPWTFRKSELFPSEQAQQSNP